MSIDFFKEISYNIKYKKERVDTMAFFDDLGKTLSETGSFAVKKARKFAGTAKYDAQILAEQKVLDSLLKKLARLSYDSVKALEDKSNSETYIQVTSEMMSLCKDIEASDIRISNLKNEKNNVKKELT